MLSLAPDIFSYNLMLRCIKECKGGDKGLLHEILESSPSKRINRERYKEKEKVNQEIQLVLQGKLPPPENRDSQQQQRTGEKYLNSSEYSGEKTRYFQIPANNESVEVNLKENMELEIISQPLPVPLEENHTATKSFPDLLAKNFSTGNVVDLISLDKCEER